MLRDVGVISSILSVMQYGFVLFKNELNDFSFFLLY